RPGEEGVAELALVAEAREPLPQLGRQLFVDVQPEPFGRLAEDRLVEPEEPAKLLERALVVLDPQLDDDIGQARVTGIVLDDEQRCGLLAAPVAAGRLRRGEAVPQAPGKGR